MAKPATVYLTGAGPGDPELLTVRALGLIENADVVVYDRLVSSRILNLIPEGTARIDVGKRPGCHPVPQDSINAILVRLARAGQQVVRLKGGDPMIFGRGGEEVQALRAHGIKVETVPGITAAQGCAASLNLPLTCRGVASSVTFVTGHSKDGALPEMDWQALSAGHTTLVIYMGTAGIAAITATMARAGVSAAMPAIAIASGTLADQRNVHSSLSQLAGDTARAGLDGPVLFIIGKAAGLAAGVVMPSQTENHGIPVQQRKAAGR